MQLPLKNFATLVADMSATVQGVGSQLVDVSVGSVLRAVIEANASLALWMQWLIMLVLSLTRASTSSGSDLDSWMADYGLTRLPGVAATGSVTFARITAGRPEGGGGGGGGGGGEGEGGAGGEGRGRGGGGE